jgi:hypothetical protein
MTIIRAKHLTTFSVAPDGSSVVIGVADEEGQAVALMLPAECLKALTVTLPDMMRRVLRLQHGDPSLRLVYPITGWESSAARGRAYTLSRCARPTASMYPSRWPRKTCAKGARLRRTGCCTQCG